MPNPNLCLGSLTGRHAGWPSADAVLISSNSRPHLDALSVCSVTLANPASPHPRFAYCARFGRMLGDVDAACCGPSPLLTGATTALTFISSRPYLGCAALATTWHPAVDRRNAFQERARRYRYLDRGSWVRGFVQHANDERVVELKRGTQIRELRERAPRYQPARTSRSAP